MKVTPQIIADFDEYPELRIMLDAALRRVVELMQIHDIVELRRIHKTGVYDRPYVKDVVTPIGLPSVPSSVAANRNVVGKIMLDYLEAVGVRGLVLELSKEEAMAVNALWTPQEQKTEKAESATGEGVNKATGDQDTPAPVSVDKSDESLDPTPVKQDVKKEEEAKRDAKSA